MTSKYIKCIEKASYDWGTNIIGRIYEVTGSNYSDYFVSYLGEKYPSVDKSRFIPSTKEEYDAKFKSRVVEPTYEVY